MPGKGKGRISDGDGSFYRGSDPQFSTAAAGLFSEPPSRVPASQSTAGPAAEYSAPPPRMTAKHSLDLDPQGAVSDPKRARIDGSAGAAAAVDDDTALHVKMTNLSTEIAQDGAKLLNQYITEALEGKHHAKGVTKEGRAMAGLFEINYERIEDYILVWGMEDIGDVRIA